MNTKQETQNFVERIKLFYHDNYRNITIRLPIITGVLLILLAIVTLLTYGVELERLNWITTYYSTNYPLYDYFKQSAEYLLMITILSIGTAIILFVIAFIFDKRDTY